MQIAPRVLDRAPYRKLPCARRAEVQAGPVTGAGGALDVRDLALQLWRQDVVALLRADFYAELQSTTWHDIDWGAWDPYFWRGRSTREAIERALERDL